MSPIELPPIPKDRGQSHDYPNTTKGNPIQGRPKSPFPSPTPAPHPIVSGKTVGWPRRIGRE